MMKSNNKSLRHWSIAGVFAVMAMASLWHFVYDWMPCGFLSVISPVNESPWEHAKLFFIPPLIWYAVMYFTAGRGYPNYLFAAAVSLVLMPAFMLLLFNIYSKFVQETLPLDIANALVTIAFGIWAVFRLSAGGGRLSGPVFNVLAAVIVAGLVVLYSLMTYYPPRIPLFLDSQMNGYGIPR